MTGASPLTSTTSVAPPTSIVKVSTETREPGLTATPARLSVLNDGIDTSIVYVPGAMLTRTKSPVPFVTTGGAFVPRASSVRVIVAPGMTPPCASLTVPETVPVVTCALAGVATMRAMASPTRANPLRNLNISCLLYPRTVHETTGARDAPARQVARLANPMEPISEPDVNVFTAVIHPVGWQVNVHIGRNSTPEDGTATSSDRAVRPCDRGSADRPPGPRQPGSGSPPPRRARGVSSAAR